MKMSFSFLKFILILNLLVLIVNCDSCVYNENCRLPNCNCDKKNIPVNYAKSFRIGELPQLVVLSIDDDDLDMKSYQVYRRLLKDFKNPNGCPIQATFFVSDTNNRTSYCLVRNLYDRKHEIAISTVNNTCPSKPCQTDPNFRSWTYQIWNKQITNMRQRLKKFSLIPETDIVGFRSPITEPASDMHYRIIYGRQFLYDSSLITNDPNIIWPFTLDHQIEIPLMNNGPIRSYPGLWELPISINLNKKNMLCGKIWEDTCGYAQEELEKFFRRHFLRAYYTNRAPLIFHINARWLKRPANKKISKMVPKQGRLNVEFVNVTYEQKDYPNLKGLMNFINKTITNNKDVYFVTAQQVVQWMRLLPRLEDEHWFNLTELMNREILDDCGEYDFPLKNENKDKNKNKNTANRKWDDVKEDDESSSREDEKSRNQDFDLEAYHMSQVEGIYKSKLISKTYEYDGKCDILKMSEPDYDKEESIYLDDGLENEANYFNEKELLQWQSENLFVNDFVFYFLTILAFILITILICDKRNKKKK